MYAGPPDEVEGLREADVAAAAAAALRIESDRWRAVCSAADGNHDGGSRGRFENLEVSETAGPGMVVLDSARSTVLGLAVRSAGSVGIAVEGATASLSEIDVVDTVEDGIHLAGAADVVLERVRVHRSGGAGCRFAPGSAGQARDLELCRSGGDGLHLATDQPVRLARVTAGHAVLEVHVLGDRLLRNNVENSPRDFRDCATACWAESMAACSFSEVAWPTSNFVPSRRKRLLK